MNIILRAFAAMLFILAGLSTASAETCQFNTDWGVLTLKIDHQNNTVSGDYPHKNGRLSGFLEDHTMRGQWQQSDSRGSFVFRMTKNGFKGRWNYADQSAWRDDWNGELIKCYS